MKAIRGLGQNPTGRLKIVLLCGAALCVFAGAGRADEIASPKLEPLELKIASDKVRTFLASLKTESDAKKLDSAFDDVQKAFDKIAKDKSLESFDRYPELLAEIVRASLEFKKVGTPNGRVSPWKREETASGKTIKNEYALWLPRRYDASQSYPLVLCLASTKQTGQAYLESVFGKHEGFKNDYIIAAPTLVASNFKADKGQPQVDPSWFSHQGLWQLLALTLKDVIETYNVDPNRIYLDGYGDGGEAAFRVASAFLDLFAGVVVRSAAPPGDVYLANLRHVPVYNVIGTQDDAKIVTAATNAEAQAKKLNLDGYTLVKAEGQGSKNHFESENDKVFEWLAGKSRPLFPREVEIFTNDRRYGRAYWLQITNMEIGPEYRAFVKASFDRAANRITVDCENVYGFSILLNDSIVDLDKPFEVVTNGDQKFTGKKERSLRTALQRVHLSGDTARLFVNSVDISVN